MRTRTSDALAPLPRHWIDGASPAIRAIIGACFVAFSSYATVFLFADDIQRLLGDHSQIGLFPDRYWLGLLLALGFFVGEIMTAERWPRAYRAILVPDTIYTARQIQLGLSTMLIVLIRDWPSLVMVLALIGGGLFLVAYGAGWSLWRWISGWVLISLLVGLLGIGFLPQAIWVLGWVVAVLSGYIVARFGEALLFGKRRSMKGTSP